MTETSVISVMSQAYLKIDPSSSNKEIAARLIQAKTTEGYITSQTNELIGKISLVDVTKALVDKSEAVMFDEHPIFIKHDASLQQAIEIASEFVGEGIPIIDTRTKKLLGVVSESDLFRLYLSLQTKIADVERA